MEGRNGVFSRAKKALMTPFSTHAFVRAGTCFTVLLLVMVACKGAPTRIVAGSGDTVVVNTMRPFALPIRLLDSRGHLLDSSSVQYRWTGGATIPVSANGIVTCSQPGDVNVRASLGAIAAQLVVQCRPVTKVRGLRMMQLVVGDPPEVLPFDAVGVDGQPISPLAAHVTIQDSTVATLEGQRVRARAQGETGLTMRVGDREGFASVHVYEIANTPEGVRPGQHVAVRVRLKGGEMRKWRISASPQVYYVAMLADSSANEMLLLAITGANCVPALDEHSYFCLAQQDASVIVYHPKGVSPALELVGTLAVWRQERP